MSTRQDPLFQVRARRASAALATLGALLVIGLAGPAPAHACSCAQQWDPEGWFKSADGAIIGKLVRVVDRGDPNNSASASTYVYRVRRVFKGRGRGLREGKLVRVRGARDGSSCGLPRKRGRRLGLFLDRRRGRWHSGLCSTRSPKQMRQAAKQSGRASAAEASSSGSTAGCNSG